MIEGGSLKVVNSCSCDVFVQRSRATITTKAKVLCRKP